MNKLFKRLSAMALTASLAAGSIWQGAGIVQVRAATADLTDGLVGHWTFEGETDTDRLASQASVANVSAVKTGSGVTLNASGGIGGNGAVSFSGDNTSYLTLNLVSASQGLSSSNAFTIGAWVKYAALPSGGNGTSVFHQDGTDSGRAILTISNNGRHGTYLDGNNRYCTQAVQKNEWHHVMMAVDASSVSPRKVYFYLDGVKTNEETFSGALVDGNGNIRVGAHRVNAGSDAVNGTMDEIRYYNKVVDADTVKAIYDLHSGIIEAQEVRESLNALITSAKALNPTGTDTVSANLKQAIQKAEGIRDDASADVTAIEAMIRELQAAVNAYEAGMPITIEVDTSDVVREIPSAMFGINHRYHKYGYGTWDKENNQMNEDFNTLAKEAHFGSVRYPGGTVSNLFTWKDTIGPQAERTTTIAGNNFYSNAGEQPVDPAFGVDEAMTWIYDDLNAEAIFVYGLGRGNAQDAADLVEYLNAPNDGSNPGGGTDWAAVRAANGHPKPYGVKRFEIGNEFSDTGQDYWMSGDCDIKTNSSNPVVDLYIEGDVMTISGQSSYYQTNNKVAKKGDWRAAASLSDGNPNEERYVYYTPVVQDTAEVFVGGTKWNIVSSLEGQGQTNVCTFDYETGKITFGDGTNGNIPASGAQITCNYKTDQSGFVDYYDAMKAIDPTIEIYSGIYDGRQNTFIDRMHAKGYDDKYDCVIIHPYSNGVTSYEDSLVKAKNFSNNIATYKNKMHTVTNDDSKKVAVSEFGILSVSPASNYQSSLGHAIYIANHMIDCVNSGAAYQNKHCLVDTAVTSDNLGNWQQCVIQCHENDAGNQFVVTPSAHLFSIFNQMTGNHQVSETINGNDVFTGSGNSAVNNINVYSTKDDSGNAYVMIVNNKKTGVSAVDISVDDWNLTGEEIDVWCLTSENIEDINTLEDSDKIAVQKETVTAEGENLSYTLKPHSVYSFKIPKVEMEAFEIQSSEGGTVEANPTAAPGKEITVTAVPDATHGFLGWYIDGERVSKDLAYSYIYSAAQSAKLTAKFASEFAVNVKAENGGTVTGGSKNAPYRQPITVTAVASAGAVFAGWFDEEGNCVSNDLSYTFTVETETDLTAKFIKNKYMVTVQAEAGGTVTGGQTEVEHGTAVTVKAVPNAGYEFVGWYEGNVQISKSAVYTFQIQKNTELTAKFTPKQSAPTAPTGVKAKKTKKGIQISWKTVNGADGYIIYRSYKKTKGYKKITEIKKAGTKKYVDKKAKKGKTAYYKIQSYKTVNGKKVVSTAFSKIVKKKR